jgi:hypothetical protein
VKHKKRYRIRNVTRNEWSYVWAEDPPTVDPNYPSDTYDLSVTSVVENSRVRSSLSYSFGAHGAETSFGTYKALAVFGFQGTELRGTPILVELVADISDSGQQKEGSIRLYDVTNNKVIFETLVNSSSRQLLVISADQFINTFPEDLSILELQGKKTSGNISVRCYSVSILF